MAAEIHSPEDYTLKRVSISADRFRRSIDVTNITIEINVFENINTPYLTGSLSLMDDNGLLASIGIKGTERVTMIVVLPFPQAKEIEKTFIISRIDDIIPHNDKTNVVKFSLIEESLFLNNVKSISKMYDGNGETIISKVIEDHLGKKLYGKVSFKPSFQRPFRILAPYITPFHIIKMVLDKMTTENGSPYFLHSSLYTDDLVLTDLDTILSSDPITTVPFVYSQSQGNEGHDDILRQGRSIYKISGQKLEDTLLLSEMGAIGSLFETTNISTGEVTQTEFSVLDVYSNLEASGVLPANSVSLLDDLFVPDYSGKNNSTLPNYRTRRFHQVSGGLTYPFSEGVSNYTNEIDGNSYNLRINRYALLNLLFKNVYELYVPGYYFLDPESFGSVGRNIDINTFTSEIEDDKFKSDPTRSGKFIITAKRHVFNAVDYKHTVSLSVSRISDARPTV